MQNVEAQCHIESKNIDYKCNFEVIEYVLVRQLAHMLCFAMPHGSQNLAENILHNHAQKIYTDFKINL